DHQVRLRAVQRQGHRRGDGGAHARLRADGDGGRHLTVDVARRLPGLQFQAVPPPSPRVLPRMDVAAFVGYATGGPFHLPVAIEDGADFAATFGDDLQLAIDPLSGAPVSTQLGSAVRTFLRNGGKRCWVIRVGATPGTTT